MAAPHDTKDHILKFVLYEFPSIVSPVSSSGIEKRTILFLRDTWCTLVHTSRIRNKYLLDITACTRVPPAALKKKKSHNPQATGQNKSKNCGPTTRRIDSAAVGRIKGIPIHSLEGSCSGYPLIPYSAASDACSRRCVNPAAKKTAFYLAPAARLSRARGRCGGRPD